MGERLPHPQQAVLCDAVEGDKFLNDQEVEVEIAIRNFDEFKKYWVPEGLNWWNQGRC